MNSIFYKISAFLVGALILVYVVYQSFTTLYNPYQTQIVTIGEYVQEVDVSGFFVRDESVIEVSKDGVVSYLYENAQRIPNDAIIASVYRSDEDLYRLEKIDTLTKEKEILEEAQSRDAIEGLKLDMLNSQIYTAKTSLVQQVDENNFTSMQDTFGEIMLLMNRTKVCVDHTVTFDDTISVITSEIDRLKANMPEPTSSVKSENSGYFSNTTDGYEAVFSAEMLEDLTIDGVENIVTGTKLSHKQSYIGKLVNENSWNFVSLVPVKELEILEKAFQTSKPVSLQFQSTVQREIQTQIVDIITEPEKDNAIVVFKGSSVDDNLINMRFETPKAVVGRYSGIIIPKEAVRLQNGVVDDETGVISDRVKGVQTLYGQTPKFKRIDLVYEDEYVVVSRPGEKNGYVAVYDQVIIKGKNLNDPPK